MKPKKGSSSSSKQPRASPRARRSKLQQQAAEEEPTETSDLAPLPTDYQSDDDIDEQGGPPAADFDPGLFPAIVRGGGENDDADAVGSPRRVSARTGAALVDGGC